MQSAAEVSVSVNHNNNNTMITKDASPKLASSSSSSAGASGPELAQGENGDAPGSNGHHSHENGKNEAGKDSGADSNGGAEEPNAALGDDAGAGMSKQTSLTSGASTFTPIGSSQGDAFASDPSKSAFIPAKNEGLHIEFTPSNHQQHHQQQPQHQHQQLMQPVYDNEMMKYSNGGAATPDYSAGFRHNGMTPVPPQHPGTGGHSGWGMEDLNGINYGQPPPGPPNHNIMMSAGGMPPQMPPHMNRRPLQGGGGGGGGGQWHQGMQGGHRQQSYQPQQNQYMMSQQQRGYNSQGAMGGWSQSQNNWSTAGMPPAMGMNPSGWGGGGGGGGRGGGGLGGSRGGMGQRNRGFNSYQGGGMMGGGGGGYMGHRGGGRRHNFPNAKIDLGGGDDQVRKFLSKLGSHFMSCLVIFQGPLDTMRNLEQFLPDGSKGKPQSSSIFAPIMAAFHATKFF